MVLGLVMDAQAATAASAADAAPHYESLKRTQAYLREGPSYGHRILWVYRRAGYPFEVIASFDAWTRVRDADGTVGWMHDTMLSSQRTVLVIGKARAAIRGTAEPGARVIAWAEPGVVARLKACKPLSCEVAASGLDGWIDRDRIWGVGAHELLQ